MTLKHRCQTAAFCHIFSQGIHVMHLIGILAIHLNHLSNQVIWILSKDFSRCTHGLAELSRGMSQLEMNAIEPEPEPDQNNSVNGQILYCTVGSL